jgi:hypothetical protein
VGERKAAGGVPASTGIATATPPGALKWFGPTAEPVSKGCAGPAKPVAMLWWLMSTGERAGNWRKSGSATATRSVVLLPPGGGLHPVD